MYSRTTTGRDTIHHQQTPSSSANSFASSSKSTITNSSQKHRFRIANSSTSPSERIPPPSRRQIPPKMSASSSLSSSSKKFAPLPATLPDGATQRQLSFTNNKGERLVGTFVDGSSREVVLLCHGYMANTGMCQFPALAAALAASGFSSFRFDHPCAWRGESERKGPFLMGNHGDEVEDMAAAAQFLRGENFNVVCLLGHSKGGTNVIQYAAQYGDIQKVVNLAGRFHCREGTVFRFGNDIFERLADAGSNGIPRTESDGFQWMMTEQDFLNRATMPMEEFAAAIKAEKRVQLMCVHGRHDATIPWEESKKCAELSGGEVVIVDGDHNFRQPEHGQQMIEAVVEFVSRK